MKNKAKIFLICSLVVSESLVVGTNIRQYGQIQTLRRELSTYEILLDSVSDIVDRQEAELMEYKNQILYYEDQMVLLDAYIEKEKLNEKASVKETRHSVVFDATDIRIPSGATVEDLTLALKGTELEHLAPAYVQLEEKYGWNAISAASITAHETYWGTDYKATEYNNLGGIRERSGDYWMFSSQEECVDYMGSLILRKYLSQDGEYFNGYSLEDINIMYCPVGGNTWSSSITQIGNGLLKKIGSRG